MNSQKGLPPPEMLQRGLRQQEPGRGGGRVPTDPDPGRISVTPDADMDLQPSGGDQVPVPSRGVGLGSRPAPKSQASPHHPLHDPAGGHGHHQHPLCEWENPGGLGWGAGGQSRGQGTPGDPTPEGRDGSPLVLGLQGSPSPRLADSGPQVERKELDFGNVVVNGEQSRLLALLNEGNCTLYYRLFLEQCSPEGARDEALGTGPGPGTWAG